MLFNEIYGCYYSAVASILKLAIQNELNEKRMKEVIDKKAFAESYIEISSALNSGKWKLIDKDYKTQIKHTPTIPLTTLELRWLKTISLDKRMKLFDVNFDFLKDIEPLFMPDDYILFDKYNDGDLYEDETYIKNFRTILKAIKENKIIKAEYVSMKGEEKRISGTPIELEYSEKDDRFRANLVCGSFISTLNLSGIKECEIIGNSNHKTVTSTKHLEEYFVVELFDDRKALERFLLHFAHFKKEAERICDNRYKITVYYDKSDRTELVIRVLSFGPFVKVQEPAIFVNLIKDRLRLQKSCGLK